MWNLILSCKKWSPQICMLPRLPTDKCGNKWVNIHFIPEQVGDESAVNHVFEYSWRVKAGFLVNVPSNQELDPKSWNSTRYVRVCIYIYIYTYVYVCLCAYVYTSKDRLPLEAESWSLTPPSGLLGGLFPQQPPEHIHGDDAEPVASLTTGGHPLVALSQRLQPRGQCLAQWVKV